MSEKAIDGAANNIFQEKEGCPHIEFLKVKKVSGQKLLILFA